MNRQFRLACVQLVQRKHTLYYLSTCTGEHSFTFSDDGVFRSKLGGLHFGANNAWVPPMFAVGVASQYTHAPTEACKLSTE